ncbi:hypothetical protein [Streptomyces violaceus]|uniref:Uncharacterized protein n=1 Tax=Streptomyces violaceus TaxID=1936 RepID=A0ABZ1P2P8_STRVL
MERHGDRGGVALGLACGVMWWTVGALWIMPANMGTPVFECNDVTSSSLGTHLVFGLPPGLAFGSVARAMSKQGAGRAG